MSGWSQHKGTVIALDQESIDTDQLIPARFMSTPRSEGYGRFLLHDLRIKADGTTQKDHPLNCYPDASILVSRRNFGSGSSREAAVYALVDFGVRAILAPSFGDIFASNAVNNGLLPARIREDEAEAVIASLETSATIGAIDIRAQSADIAGRTISFDLDAVWREKLINGWDDIDLTAQHRADIKAFRAQLSQTQAWAFPTQETAG